MAASIGVSAVVANLSLPCLSGYYFEAECRMALTGAVIFAFIISSVGLRNCVCVDTLPSYLKTAGTAEGTGTTAPDSKKNASLLAEWADFHFPTFFLDQMRLVACVDSGMCKRQLHGWFEKMAKEGIHITALPLSVS